MQLYNLLDGIDAEYFPGLEGMEIGGICIDSRKAKPGDIFVCLNGVNANGKNFVDEALSNGARAFVCEESTAFVNAIKVKDARAAYSQISKNFYDRACDKLRIIAVTGTNGKTTTTNLIAEILKSCGANVATVGTMGIKYGDVILDTGFTTPDPHILHKAFKEMAASGVEYVIMEASAHAIALKKLVGINFEIGVLTNITQDHLDYFKTMECYANTKLSFFNKNNMKLGLICIDDPYAQSLLSSSDVPLVTYGQKVPSDISAENVKCTLSGTRFTCNCLGEKVNIKSNMTGSYNVSNALAAIGVCKSIGLDLNMIATYFGYIKPVEGRFNVIKHPKCSVVIDYAHTPDGLENVLKCAREHAKGNLIALFGCGGDRDREKRPLMGKIACENADLVVLTNDNPRFEEPSEIINQIKAGVDESKCVTIENRKDAICQTLDRCNKNDILVILGKGAEKYQEIKGEKLPYNDFDVVYGYFRERIKSVKESSYEHNS